MQDAHVQTLKLETDLTTHAARCALTLIALFNTSSPLVRAQVRKTEERTEQWFPIMTKTGNGLGLST